MSRWEFMRQLEELLSDISPNEREEALQYYNDYFNDAGKENEKEVMEALGTPQQVAKTVKEGLSENGSTGEFTENGFSSAGDDSRNAIIKRNKETSQKENTAGEAEHGQTAGQRGNASKAAANQQDKSSREQSGKKESMPVWAIILIVIGGIFLSPFILAALCAAISVLLGGIAAVIGTIFGFAVASLVLYVVAVTLFVAGFGCMLAHPIAGIGLLGGGCICASLGILFMLLVAFLAGKCIPGICQGIVYIVKKLFGKKGGEQV